MAGDDAEIDKAVLGAINVVDICVLVVDVVLDVVVTGTDVEGDAVVPIERVDVVELGKDAL